MWNYSPTLTSRVTIWISMMSLGLFLILSFFTLFVTLTMEDLMIHNILRHVDQGTISLEHDVKTISVDELIDMGYKYATKTELAEKLGGFGEFPLGNDYYHFMIQKDHILLLNSTDLIATEKRIKGIFTLLLKVFIPCLIVVLIVSRMIAKRALKPFDTLKSTFLRADKKADDIKKLNQQIKEADVRQIADELALALAQKEQVLGQQIAFNQGVSHELRTPLQVMTHAIELISLKFPELTQQDVYGRLVKSVGRMHRTSEAMLWLTSTADCQENLQVNDCIAHMQAELLQTYSQHGLAIEVNEQAELSLPIPDSIFEFILYNIASNTVHHGLDEHGIKLLQIDISGNSVRFKNRIATDEHQGPLPTTNFGIGLSLVSQLCERFGLAEHIESNESYYSITITV